MHLTSEISLAGCVASALAVALLGGAGPSSAEGDGEEDGAFFRERVRPILETRCFRCHGPDRERVRGGLRMDGRASIVHGGGDGAVFDPAEPARSRLLALVRRVDPDDAMPPDDPLPDDELAVLEEWVLRGVPWPSDEGVPSGESRTLVDVRDRWPFVPLERPEVPDVEGADHPIDAFVLARLREEGLATAPRAPDRTLVRRLHFDLLGLPPSYELVEAFLAYEGPDGWALLVDRLLERRAFAEHQARRWLDVVRYAESDGFEHDATKPYAWRYRDWVIDAFDADMPYDRFLRMQLAGDELEDAGPQGLVATGWFHLGPWKEPSDPEQEELDWLDDVTRVVSEGFLGLTVGCARCHDHRFDPIAQEDYYGLVAFFRNVAPYERPLFAEDSAVLQALRFGDAEREQWERDRQERVDALEREREEVLAGYRRELFTELVAAHSPSAREALATRADERTAAQEAILDEIEAGFPRGMELRRGLQGARRVRLDRIGAELGAVRAGKSFEGDLEWALRIRERGGEPLPTYVAQYGDAHRPGELVEPRFLPLLVRDDSAADPGLPPTAAAETTRGRRAVLADWIASPGNPMTARVMANRVWQSLFGRGLVPTPNDFGAAGPGASHPELLDWLASEFVENGWSVKELYRHVLTSETYRLSSAARIEASRLFDPSNRLLWRQNPRRLEAESIRDAMLAVGGGLVDAGGGPSFHPRLAREVLASASKPGNGWGVSDADDRRRRSIYAFVKRGLPVPMLQVHDAANADLPTGRRAVTTTVGQALTLWNGDFAAECARRLADAARTAAGGGASDEARVDALFRLALARRPTEEEVAACVDYLHHLSSTLEEFPPVAAIEPAVPERLQDEFLLEAPPHRLLQGPRSWRYVRGLWGNWYNETEELDSERGPAALSRVTFEEGRLVATLRLREGTTRASLYLRAKPRGNVLSGIELRIDPVEGSLSVYEHPTLPGFPLIERGRVAIEVPTDEVQEVAIDLDGPSAVVAWNGREVLESNDLTTLGRGAFGASSRGGALELLGLAVAGEDRTDALHDGPPPTAEERAFVDLCLTILNLNEFVYVD